MSLRGFHILFVFATVTLSVFFSHWCFKQYGLTASGGYMAGCVLSVLAAVGFIIYGIMFAKKIKD